MLESLRQLIDAAPIAVAVYEGPQHIAALSNAKHREMTGGRVALGKPLLESLPELAGQPVMATLAEVYRTGETKSAREVAVRSAAGEERWFDVAWQPLEDIDGKVSGVLVAAVEVTEYVLARHRLEAVQEGLRESERQFRDLVDNLPELAWSAQPDGYIDFYNRRWYEYTGTTFEQMQGWGWKSVHDPAMVDAVVERWERSIATGEAFEMEFPLRRADGAFRWFLTRIRPLRDSHGRIVRWFGTNTDVDDVKRARVEREELVAQLRGALQTRDEFLSIAAHELRTPLTALHLQLQLMQRGAEGAMGARLATAVKQTQRLGRLVDQLLDVSRMSEGPLALAVEDVDLVRLVSETVERHRAIAQDAGCRLTMEARADLPARCDRLRIEQLVTNLLNNAIKYGAGKPIAVSVTREGDFALLTVTDEGIGIDPDHVQRVFGRFQRAVSARNYGGLGLGLYISRQIARAHGGDISVQSEPGRGAKFTARIPIAAAAAQVPAS